MKHQLSLIGIDDVWRCFLFEKMVFDIPHKSCPILRRFNDTPNKFLGTFAITGGALLVQ